MVDKEKVIKLVDELSKKNPNMAKVHTLCNLLSIKTNSNLELQMQIVLKAVGQFKKSDFKELKV